MEKTSTNRSNFSGSIGFVLAAAGSAVGLGNIWRFPYLAAKDGGGLFLLVYVVLALTFGFTLLTTEIAIGRKTAQSPLTAYKYMHKSWGWIGIFSCLIPVIILPYYSVIGGWILKYLAAFVSGNAAATTADGYFTGFITSQWEPVICFLAALAQIYNNSLRRQANYQSSSSSSGVGVVLSQLPSSSYHTVVPSPSSEP